MTRRRFYAPPGAFNSNLESVILDTAEARHLREVLRLKSGDEVYVFNGEGKEFHCRIDESQRDTAQLKVISEVAPARPESPLIGCKMADLLIYSTYTVTENSGI